MARALRYYGRLRGKGFALVTVIWGLALITLLIVSFMTTARLRLQMAFNIAAATQANLAADAAVGAALIALVAERGAGAATNAQTVHDGAPNYCSIGNAVASIAFEDEIGKIDLNGASPTLLKMALVGFGVAARDADAIANAIVAFRTQPAAVGAVASVVSQAGEKPFAPKLALFQTVLELDQVEGVTPSVFRALVPFVTVHSHATGIDRRAAPPALFGALAGFSEHDVEALRAEPSSSNIDRNDPRFPQAFNQPGAAGVVLAHVEILLPTGQSAVKDAILDLNEPRGPAFALKELRRGTPRDLAALRARLQDGGGLSGC